MGNGTYSVSARNLRSEVKGYTTKLTHEIFRQQNINSAMNPYGVNLRESRDSEEHPNSLAIVLALDVTGSMGSIPHHLVKEGLPNIMDKIIKGGIKDPQLLFMGIGDHEYDASPLQIGQFESSDELLDKWLTDIYLEGGGGGNNGESYMLAWYFAANHTGIDCFEKRKQKGFLFTIGDEPNLRSLPDVTLKGIMGDIQYKTEDSSILLDRAREMYNVYHLHIKQTGSGSRQKVMDSWKQTLNDNLIIIDRHEDISRIIPEIVCNQENFNIPQEDNISEEKPKEEMML